MRHEGTKRTHPDTLASISVSSHNARAQGKLAGAQRLRRKFTENLRKFLFLVGKPMESAFGGKVFLGDRGCVFLCCSCTCRTKCNMV